MTSPIRGTPPLALAPPRPTPGAGPAADAASFQDLLLGSLRRTNALQQEARQAIEAGLTGGDVSQIEVFTAVKKADLAMRMMLQVRNKLVEAYQEIQQMRM